MDTSYQTLGQLHERRKQVVRLHRQGLKVMGIASLSGLSYLTVRAVLDRLASGGWENVRPTARGRPKAEGRVLSAA